jgi:hypothetical protein
MCSPRNLIQGLGLDGTVGNDLKHGNWIMVLAHGTYDHSIKLRLYNPYYTLYGDPKLSTVIK